MTHRSRLRVAVAGVGHWHAHRYLTSVTRLGEDLVAVWDENESTAQWVAGQFGAATGPDLMQLLADQSPDVVIAMAEHAQMPELLAMLLTTSAALIMEKPLGIRSSDLAPLVLEAEHTQRFAAVAFINRYTPFWKVQRELRDAGRLGDLCHASLRLINGSPERYRRDGVNWMLEPERSGGGCLINLGTHLLDAFLQLADGEVVVDSAQLGHAVHKLPVEDHALALLRSSSGLTGLIETGYCYAGLSGGDVEWRLITRNAYITQRPDGVSVQTLDDGQSTHVPGLSSADAYHLFVKDTLDAFREGRPPIATLRDGLGVLNLVDSIYAKGALS